MYYVYVLRNEKGRTYVGYTTDLDRRLKEHNRPHTGYTGKGQWEYVYYEAYKDERDARDREKTLKESTSSKRWLKERLRYSLKENS